MGENEPKASETGDASEDEFQDFPDFPDADFYDCDDEPERLMHSDPESALADWLDCFTEEDFRVRLTHGVVVDCYKAEVVSERFIERLAERFVEDANEAFDDEYGDPEGEIRADAKARGVKALPLFREAVRALYEGAHVWRCKVVARVPVSAAQLEAFARKEWPELFEAPAGAGKETV